jgi:L-ascorbate metabolism protein UlaG (beta-lactamase superfamily)
MSLSYLRPDVVIEPLVAQWFAVPHVVSPASSPRVVTNRQLALMRSFLQNPRVHEMAARTPAMAGGAFFQFGGERAEELRVLLQKTEAEAAHLVRFAQAQTELEKWLLENARGESLEPHYARLPEPLRGRVELVYDLYHRPTLRLREPVLYRTPLYRESAQQLRLFRSRGDVRHFYATPRLREPEDVWLTLPFRSSAVDDLARARFEPVDVRALKASLGVSEDDSARFEALFTPEAPSLAPRYDGEGVRIRYFGHACVVVEADGVTIATDPCVAYETGNGRSGFHDLPPRLDWVLITHAHPDHFSLEWLLALRSRIGTIVVPRNGGGTHADPSLRLLLRAAGFPSVIEVDEAESLELAPGMRLLTLPFQGEHCDLDIRGKLAYHLRVKERSLLMLGDTNLLDPAAYDPFADELGRPDMVFAGLESEGAPITWGYGPLFDTEPPRNIAMARRSNSMNAERTWPLVEKLRPHQLHIYSMGCEPWMRHVMGIAVDARSPQVRNAMTLVTKAREHGMQSELLVLKWESVLERAG